jgi:hypothetical protein
MPVALECQEKINAIFHLAREKCQEVRWRGGGSEVKEALASAMLALNEARREPPRELACKQQALGLLLRILDLFQPINGTSCRLSV